MSCLNSQAGQAASEIRQRVIAHGVCPKVIQEAVRDQAAFLHSEPWAAASAHSLKIWVTRHVSVCDHRVDWNMTALSGAAGRQPIPFFPPGRAESGKGPLKHLARNRHGEPDSGFTPATRKVERLVLVGLSHPDASNLEVFHKTVWRTVQRRRHRSLPSLCIVTLNAQGSRRNPFQGASHDPDEPRPHVRT